MGNEKLVAAAELAALGEKYRFAGRKVVWTNGCFDLFHEGHALSLAQAAALGDALVVGLNSDRSVRELKGEGRPLCPQQARAEVLCALECVDHVVIFDGKRCTPELALLRPAVYAQGADYTLETIDQGERRAVEDGGGSVAFLPFIDGVSTSLLLKKIRRSDPERVTSAAFGLIRNAAGELLLAATRYAEGLRWGLPGGGQVRGERLEQTVLRECREEVGLAAEISRYVGVIERIDPGLSLHLVLHLFELDAPAGAEPVCNAAEDIEAAGWFGTEKLSGQEGWVLGRRQWLQYLEDPATFPRYVFMGPGEE